MIEVSELTAMAAARRPIDVLVPREYRGGKPHGIYGERMMVLILWPAPAHEERRLQRDDGWIAMRWDGSSWHSVTIFAADAEVVGGMVRLLQPPLNPIEPTSYRDPRDLLEMVLLAARDALPMAFTYRRDATGQREERRGVVLGCRSGLAFLSDADRGGETRSFRLDRISAFHCYDANRIPTWDGSAYITPPAPPVAIPQGW